MEVRVLCMLGSYLPGYIPSQVLIFFSSFESEGWGHCTCQGHYTCQATHMYLFWDSFVKLASLALNSPSFNFFIKLLVWWVGKSWRLLSSQHFTISYTKAIKVNIEVWVRRAPSWYRSSQGRAGSEPPEHVHTGSLPCLSYMFSLWMDRVILLKCF